MIWLVVHSFTANSFKCNFISHYYAVCWFYCRKLKTCNLATFLLIYQGKYQLFHRIDMPTFLHGFQDQSFLMKVRQPNKCYLEIWLLRKKCVKSSFYPIYSIHSGKEFRSILMPHKKIDLQFTFGTCSWHLAVETKSWNQFVKEFSQMIRFRLLNVKVQSS